MKISVEIGPSGVIPITVQKEESIVKMYSYFVFRFYY
jgi:hypothetical protein